MKDVNTVQKEKANTEQQVKTGIKKALPGCPVPKHYRQRITHVLDEVYAGLMWLA